MTGITENATYCTMSKDVVTQQLQYINMEYLCYLDYKSFWTGKKQKEEQVRKQVNTLHDHVDYDHKATKKEAA